MKSFYISFSHYSLVPLVHLFSHLFSPINTLVVPLVDQCIRIITVPFVVQPTFVSFPVVYAIIPASHRSGVIIP